MAKGLGSAAAVAVVLLVVGPCAGLAEEPGTGFSVDRYKVKLAVDFAGKSVRGTEEIRLHGTADGLRAAVFSGNALAVDEVTMDGQPVSVSTERKALSFALPQTLAAGQKATLRMSFHGMPREGVVFSATSMYTSYSACDWMVCLEDAPGDKAAFELQLQVPTGMTSLAVGKLVKRRRGADGGELDVWRTERPYSAYLYDFAIGKFNTAVARQDGATLRYVSDLEGEPELLKDFAETPAMVRFLAEKAGMGLPAKGYTQLLVAGDEAQEAATYSILGKQSLDPANDWAIVHEMAHQWWGNLVTCATWKDFWLNESMAVFMTAAWKEHKLGPTGYQQELELARGRVAKVQKAGWDKPLAYRGEYPDIRVRRTIQYSKGALFLDHLRTELGDATFWAGIRLYTRQGAGGTVTSADFQRAMEKASGRDLSAEFAEWVFGKEQ